MWGYLLGDTGHPLGIRGYLLALGAIPGAFGATLQALAAISLVLGALFGLFAKLSLVLLPHNITRTWLHRARPREKVNATSEVQFTWSPLPF